MPELLFISYSGAFGGAERVLLQCADAIENKCWLACPEGPLAEHARDAGITVFPTPGRRAQLRASRRDRLLAAPRLLSHAGELRALARNLDPDAIVAWGMRSGIASLGYCGRPIAFAHNDMLPGRLVAAAVRAAAAHADVVIVPSRAVAVDLDPHGRLTDRLRVIAPGVDLDRFKLAATPAQPPEVVVMGALVSWKHPELALEAIAVARARVGDVRLRLVGAPLDPDDPTPAQLAERAQRSDLAGAVQFAGERGATEAELARATCLLHCAPREPYGLVIAEALASGRPVIVPAAGGPSEIADGSCALFYPPGDAAAAARAIVDLVRDPELAARKGEAGRRRALQRLGRQRAAAGFVAALSSLARRESRPAGRLALVTVTHNSAAELQRLLASADQHLPGTQVVVVDSGSTDDSVVIAGRQRNVDTVALAENVGFGRGCNLGLREVRAPAVALVNPDVELVDDSLAALAAQALADDQPPRLLAPLVLSPDGSRQDTVHPLPASAPDLARVLVSPTFAPAGPLAPWKAGSPRPVGWAVGCALVAATDTLRRLGPFDESIFLYGEDLDLSLRAARQGIATWFWPDARVVHRRAHSSARAFGGEPFQRLASARHEVVLRRLGARRARLDDAAQAATFASRLAVKRALGLPVERERRQLRAVLRVRQA